MNTLISYWIYYEILKLINVFFCSKEIPTEFVNQAISFYNKIIDLNINNYELRNDIYNCLKMIKLLLLPLDVINTQIPNI